MRLERARYHSLVPQSLASFLVHLAFSTKNRAPIIREDLRDDMHRYLAGILSHHGCIPIRVGGVEDHLHLLFFLSRSLSVAQIVEKVKTPSSKWAKSRGVGAFAWQSGYGAFSLGPTEKDRVERYIVNQPDHHRKETFQDEFRRLLRESGLDWDEKYLWD